MSDEVITGYKVTDENIQCRGYQFVPGQWHKHEGEIGLCKSGFHFCPYPSGPWAYYDSGRLWKVQAKGVIKSDEPGADCKYVCSEIMLIEEVSVSGSGNAGDWNAGDWNTGHRNAGDWNAGSRNTGDRNAGSRNTGDGNTGNGNTGDRNTGSGNTGSGNTGDRNTGSRNTGSGNAGGSNAGNRNTGNGNAGSRNTGDGNAGSRNTGDGNTGDGNTGDGNATDYSSGFFCQEPQTVRCFDAETGLSRDEFLERFARLVIELSGALAKSDAIEFAKFSALPGITPEKLRSLHQKHFEKRRHVTPREG